MSAVLREVARILGGAVSTGIDVTPEGSHERREVEVAGDVDERVIARLIEMGVDVKIMSRKQRLKRRAELRRTTKSMPRRPVPRVFADAGQETRRKDRNKRKRRKKSRGKQ